MSTGRMPVQPSRESYSPTDRRADPASYRNAPSASQHFFSGTRANATSSGFAGRGAVNSTSRPANTARPAQNFGANRSPTSVTSSRPGWHTFTPPSSGSSNSRAMNNAGRGSFASPSGGNRPAENRPSENRSGWQGSNAPSSGSRGGSGSGYSRPSLNMRQPIVTQRNNGYGNSPYGARGYGYNAPRPSYSSPRP